jgi:hypothetical protein
MDFVKEIIEVPQVRTATEHLSGERIQIEATMLLVGEAGAPQRPADLRFLGRRFLIVDRLQPAGILCRTSEHSAERLPD